MSALLHVIIHTFLMYTLLDWPVQLNTFTSYQSGCSLICTRAGSSASVGTCGWRLQWRWFFIGGIHPRASGGHGPGSWFLGWPALWLVMKQTTVFHSFFLFCFLPQSNMIVNRDLQFLTRKMLRLLEPVLLGFHRPMAICSIWANTGIMINYLVKQNNQNTNPNNPNPGTCPKAPYFFFPPVGLWPF